MKLGYIALGCMLFAAPVAAQEKQEGKPVSVELVTFKPNSIDRVNEIEQKYFDPAAAKVGIPPIIVRLVTGPWDRLYLFPLSSMGDLDYKYTKQEAAWLTEVDKLAGGSGTGMKLLQEWNSYTERSQREVGFSNAK